ncbi:MAG: hypothetical protein Q9166_002393 [cf. Caloplaca sp. 2 TL-2023]
MTQTYIRTSNVYPSVLATCKLIRTEATKYLYSSHIFAFDDPELTVRWITAIGPSNAGLLVNINLYCQVLELPDFGMDSLQWVFQNASGLRRLNIICYIVGAGNYPVTRMKRFLRTIKTGLHAHHNLNLMVSRYEGGYEHYSDSTPVDVEIGDARLTFVASIGDSKEEIDGKNIIDVDEESAGLLSNDPGI